MHNYFCTLLIIYIINVYSIVEYISLLIFMYPSVSVCYVTDWVSTSEILQHCISYCCDYYKL